MSLLEQCLLIPCIVPVGHTITNPLHTSLAKVTDLSSSFSLSHLQAMSRSRTYGLGSWNTTFTSSTMSNIFLMIVSALSVW